MISKILVGGALGLAVIGGGAVAGVQYFGTAPTTMEPTTMDYSGGDSCCSMKSAPESAETTAAVTTEATSPFDAAPMAAESCPMKDMAECPMVKPDCVPGDPACTMKETAAVEAIPATAPAVDETATATN